MMQVGRLPGFVRAGGEPACGTMDMCATEAIIANYGLLVVFAGGLLEGETILVAASVAAHHGILSLPAVFVVATISAMLGDQTWFMAARFGADRPLVRAMVATPKVQRALDRVHRRPTLFVLSFRFICGLRIAGAIEAIFGEVKQVEGKLIAAVAVSLAVFIAFRLYARRCR